MKSINCYLYAALAACFALTSCEMKNELWGNDPNELPQGKLEIGVALKKTGVETRAESSSMPTVSTDNFPVSIVGTSAGITEFKRDFSKVTDIPKPLVLPVGEYAVTAHSPIELQEQMSEPYYAKTQPMIIQAGITTQTVVKCTMQNCRIRLTYGEEFKNAFKSWTITLNDGLSHVLTYTHENLQPADIYWHFPENKVAKLTANITAMTVAGNTVTASREMIKKEAAGPQGIDEEFFKGGDAINIPMGVEKSPEGNVTDITIKPSINFDSDNKDEFIELPTVDPTPQPEPEPPTPGPETGDGPTLNFEQGAANIEYISANEISYSIAANPSKFDANIAADKGIEKIIVTIEGGNAAFDAILADLNMDGQSFLPTKGGVNIVGNTEFDGLLTSQGLEPAPQKGAKSYTFPIGVFFQFLNITEATDPGKAHTFGIEITDAAGNTHKDTLKIHITE